MNDFSVVRTEVAELCPNDCTFPPFVLRAQHLSPSHPSRISPSCCAALHSLLIGCGFIHRPVEQSDLALTANLTTIKQGA